MFEWLGKWLTKKVFTAIVADADKRGIELFSDEHALMMRGWIDGKVAMLQSKLAHRLHGIVGWIRKRWGDQLKSDEQLDRFIGLALDERPLTPADWQKYDGPAADRSQP